VKYAFIDAEKAHYPVRLLCRCLAVSRSGYYGWLGMKKSFRPKTRGTIAVQAPLPVSVRPQKPPWIGAMFPSSSSRV